MIWNMEEISWEADIQVETSPDSPDPNILPEEWSNALECGGHGLEEILMGTENTYHTTHNGFLVGFKFEFHPGDDGKSIRVQGTCHPAWNFQGDVITEMTNTVGWAELQVRLKDPRALRLALDDLR